MKNIVLGFLGTKLDSGATDKRWERWRPTVSLVAHADFPVDRLELFLTNPEHVELAQRIADDVAHVSPQTEVVAHILDVTDPWDFPSVYGALHDFARSYEFSDDANYHVHLTTGSHVAQICLFLLTEARYFPAKILETFSHNATETWRGRLEHIDLNLKSYDKLASRFRKELAENESLLKNGIVTLNPQFNATITKLEKVSSRSAEPIMLTGPTGAGKSKLASRVYAHRVRRHMIKGPFVEVNCATLRGDSAMSTLFGHKKGAFTGATNDRPGLLKAADGGMLFLDEIGELGLDEQAMLLRALEEGWFLPMGSDVPVHSKFLLIVGTNRDLAQMVKDGTFRDDLYARINMWFFCLPGLADRREDIAPNVDYELQCASSALNCNVSFNREAYSRYMEFAMVASWKNNFRDLTSSIMRMATLAEGGRIVLEDVEDEINRLLEIWGEKGETCASVVVGQQKQGAFGGDEGFVFVRATMGTLPNADLFDLAQLEIVLQKLMLTRNMAEAGRNLFAVSRQERKSVNDSDRVKKYLARWNLEYDAVKRTLSAAGLGV